MKREVCIKKKKKAVGDAVVTTTSQGPSMTTVCFSVKAQSDASGAALRHLTMIPCGTCDFQGVFTREESACASVQSAHSLSVQHAENPAAKRTKDTCTDMWTDPGCP